MSPESLAGLSVFAHLGFGNKKKKKELFWGGYFGKAR